MSTETVIEAGVVLREGKAWCVTDYGPVAVSKRTLSLLASPPDDQQRDWYKRQNAYTASQFINMVPRGKWSVAPVFGDGGTTI